MDSNIYKSIENIVNDYFERIKNNRIEKDSLFNKFQPQSDLNNYKDFFIGNNFEENLQKYLCMSRRDIIDNLYFEFVVNYLWEKSRIENVSERQEFLKNNKKHGEKNENVISRSYNSHVMEYYKKYNYLFNNKYKNPNLYKISHLGYIINKEIMEEEIVEDNCGNKRQRRKQLTNFLLNYYIEIFYQLYLARGNNNYKLIVRSFLELFTDDFSNVSLTNYVEFIQYMLEFIKNDEYYNIELFLLEKEFSPIAISTLLEIVNNEELEKIFGDIIRSNDPIVQKEESFRYIHNLIFEMSSLPFCINYKDIWSNMKQFKLNFYDEGYDRKTNLSFFTIYSIRFYISVYNVLTQIIQRKLTNFDLNEEEFKNFKIVRREEIDKALINLNKFQERYSKNKCTRQIRKIIEYRQEILQNIYKCKKYVERKNYILINNKLNLNTELSDELEEIEYYLDDLGRKSYWLRFYFDIPYQDYLGGQINGFYY